MFKKCFAVSAVGCAATLMLLTTAGNPAGGQTPTGVYADWTLEGASGAWTGTVAFPGTALPSGTFVSTSGAPTSLASGANAFFGAQTPVGVKYGSSVDRPYALLRQSAPGQPSVTTFTFAGPTPTSDWMFGLGDVDADMVKVEALGPGDIPVPTAALGWQGAFNYCQNTPKPSSCIGPVHTDVPVWNEATSTLVGNGPDTFGPIGWFEPTAPITSLTLTFTAQSGVPIYQMWMASMTTPPTTTTTESTTTTTASTTTTTASPTTTTVGPTTSAPTPPTTATPVGHHHAAPKPRLADTGAESVIVGSVGAALLGAGVGLARLARRLSATRGR